MTMDNTETEMIHSPMVEEKIDEVEEMKSDVENQQVGNTPNIFLICPTSFTPVALLNFKLMLHQVTQYLCWRVSDGYHHVCVLSFKNCICRRFLKTKMNLNSAIGPPSAR